MEQVFYVILIPFLGTTLGSALVFFMSKNISLNFQRVLMGFAAGIMFAASVWSLIMPSLDLNSDMGIARVWPTVTGIVLGIGFIWVIDYIVPHLHANASKPEGLPRKMSRTALLILAITIHNFPEGMAVGVVVAGALNSTTDMTMVGAMALSIGIAIQNLPEGAIVSMPMRTAGNSKWKSFYYGSMSGIVEPMGAVLVILLAEVFTPMLPYMLAFAAGAMIYVTVEELIPEASGKENDLGTVGFGLGFILMMVLDVTLG